MKPPSSSLDPDLLRTVLETVATPVIALDPEARIRLFNAAAENVSGYPRSEVLGREVWFLLDPAEEERAAELFRQLVAGETERLDAEEVAWVTREGERRSLAWSTATLRGDDGTVRLLVCTAVDLTEVHALHRRARNLATEQAARQAREEALRASEARFSGIVEMASDAIVTIDEDHEVVLFNRGAEALFGWAAEEVLGEPVDRLLPEDARNRHRRHVEAFGQSPVRARRMGERQEIWGRRRDGTTFSAEASIIKLDVAGERLYTVVLRDVSERQRRERQQSFLVKVGKVLASSLELEATLSAIADLAVGFLADYCVVDLLEESGEVRRIRVSAREGADQSAAQILRDVTLDRSRPHLMSEVLETGRAHRVASVRPDHLDGLAQGETHLKALRAMEMSSYMAVPLVSRERMVGALLLVGAGERRAYDEQDLALAREVGLRAGMAVESARLYRDAQRAILARDDVLGVVSHDLGNPLQAVFIALEALEKGQAAGAGPDSEDGKTGYYLSAIRRSADLMQRLIHELLEVRRMEEGHLALEVEAIPLGALVEETLEVIEPLARVKSVELVDQVAEASLPLVEADRDRLLQVLSNLVGNAVKHTPEGGRVCVRAETGPDELRISVSDTGPGIPAEEREQVFERFWRAEKTGGKGIGLGLAIARGIVQTHGGRIWVESEEGEGSTFHFTLPLASESAGTDRSRVRRSSRTSSG